MPMPFLDRVATHKQHGALHATARSILQFSNCSAEGVDEGEALLKLGHQRGENQSVISLFFFLHLAVYGLKGFSSERLQ